MLCKGITQLRKYGIFVHIFLIFFLADHER